MTLALMFLAGQRTFSTGAHVPWVSFTLALVLSTWSILAVGFLIASIVPTARFAQPIGAVVLYPCFGCPRAVCADRGVSGVGCGAVAHMLGDVFGESA